jgi:hypothetical protein
LNSAGQTRFRAFVIYGRLVDASKERASQGYHR